ncbi:MAG TPA: hypothetical protein VNM72_10710 [Blastocatellia bacterium]|nr:hypothetical protein [Blastocatellia bacterium]
MVRKEFLELLRTDSAFREEVRRQILTDDLLTLPQKFDSLTELVAESLTILKELVGIVRTLAEAQQRTEAILQRHEEQIGEIIATQQRIFEILQRHEEQIGQLIEAQRQMEEQIRELVKAQQRTEEQLQKLVQWQQGEIGRQRGRDYEREIIRRAPILFQGGEGGSTEEFMVRQRLAEQLASILSEVPDDKDADPFLADLLWWKGDCVAVVEVSLQVNGYDVHRAAQRAATLRRAGLHVLPIVIGESWTGSDAQDAAISKKVEWKVGSDLSEGFIDFRRRAPRG